MKTTFSDLGIAAPFIKGLEALNIQHPTAIQEQVLPVVLNQQEDIVALAKTGTGKTAAFGLPLLQLIDVDNKDIQAVILAPTRELGHQIFENLKVFTAHSPAISIAAICGGIPIKPQIERLKEDTHIIVATPGRLIDLLKRDALSIKNTNY